MDKRPEGIDPDWIQFEFTVPREYAGWRADRFVANRMPRLSRTRIQKILTTVGFDEEGRSIKSNRSLAEGERVILFRPPPKEPDTPRYFGVLFEDEWILAVDKPACLPVHPTARYHNNTLTALLRERYGDDRPILAHRLDSETSGVLLCAKTKEAERALKVMFAKRRIQKLYLAIVKGVPSPLISRIEAPLGPDKDGPVHVKMAARPDGLPALTEYRVVKDLGDSSLVECRPRTGRQHQIRAHFAHIGHPIVGDKMYSDDKELFLDYLEQGMTEEIEQRTGAKRHLLHAASISFAHPITKKEVKVDAPIPDDMAAFLA
jgi:23S rRNA pseudouridine1911/1915/1917 synthase